MASDCPPRHELETFAIGGLSADDLERVCDHLGACARCRGVLSALDAAADALVDGLRGLEPDAEPEEPLPHRLELAARSAFWETDGDPAAELVIDPGQRIADAVRRGRYRIGRFELLDELGTGSFGYVFKALDTELDRTVALKVQRSPAAGVAERERFLREARSVAQLDHPSIVSLYEIGETEDGAGFLVTELVDGETLEDVIARGSVGLERAAALISEAARALQYAHEQGVIHRDVKPSNILVDGDGRPHIMDFGLAKREVGEITVTPQGEIMGTPAYMSPEQARGESHDVDARSDIYALGVILYELITGERPFQGNRRMLVLQVLEDDPRPPRRLNERIPRDLETICLEAMAKSPARRYATAAALADDLDRWRRGDPILARPLTGPARLLRWMRRNPVAASLIVGVTLGSVLGLMHFSRLQESLMRDSAVSDAGVKLEMLEKFNHAYSDIVLEMDQDLINAGGAESAPGTLPLPARLTIELCEAISASESGVRFRLYSDHPWPWRKDGGPRDDFEREALRALRDDPGAPVKEFTEIDGEPVLRYVTARVMTPSCIGCHNHHEQSPKRDWKVGDVRGALEIIRPLEGDIEKMRRNLRGTFLLVGAVSALVLVVTVGALLLRRRHRG